MQIICKLYAKYVLYESETWTTRKVVVRRFKAVEMLGWTRSAGPSIRQKKRCCTRWKKEGLWWLLPDEDRESGLVAY
jgi:hypothetical protein